MFVLDSSTSVKDSDFETMLNVTSTMISTTSIDDGKVRIGLITYSTSVQVQFELNTYENQGDIIDAIRRVKQVRGDTNIADALNVLRTRMFQANTGDRDEVENIAVIFTDANPNVNAQRTVPEANMTKVEGVRLVTIIIGDEGTKDFEQVASEPLATNKVMVEDFEDLNNSMEKLQSTICLGNQF